MQKAEIFIHSQSAGILAEMESGSFVFQYHIGYSGQAISLRMPVSQMPYSFETIPPFFDGLLPEGIQLDGLLMGKKLDKSDYMGQLLAIGEDTVGAVTIFPFKEHE